MACPRCGDRLELVALIENPPVIRRILNHLGLPTELPTAGPARDLPLLLEATDPVAAARVLSSAMPLPLVPVAFACV